MVNYACSFSQSELGKYFIIIKTNTPSVAVRKTRAKRVNEVVLKPPAGFTEREQKLY